jgi:hypothetical protein
VPKWAISIRAGTSGTAPAAQAARGTMASSIGRLIVAVAACSVARRLSGLDGIVLLSYENRTQPSLRVFYPRRCIQVKRHCTTPATKQLRFVAVESSLPAVEVIHQFVRTSNFSSYSAPGLFRGPPRFSQTPSAVLSRMAPRLLSFSASCVPV